MSTGLGGQAVLWPPTPAAKPPRRLWFLLVGLGVALLALSVLGLYAMATGEAQG